MLKRKHSAIVDEGRNCKALSKIICDASRVTEMTISLADLETDLKEIFQMGNKKSKILTAELLMLFETWEQFKDYQQSSQSNANRCVRSFSPRERVKVKVLLNIHYWLKCKMSETFVEDNLATSKFKTFIPLSQF